MLSLLCRSKALRAFTRAPQAGAPCKRRRLSCSAPRGAGTCRLRLRVCLPSGSASPSVSLRGFVNLRLPKAEAKAAPCFPPRLREPAASCIRSGGVSLRVLRSPDGLLAGLGTLRFPRRLRKPFGLAPLHYFFIKINCKPLKINSKFKIHNLEFIIKPASRLDGDIFLFFKTFRQPENNLSVQFRQLVQSLQKHLGQAVFGQCFP